MSAAPEVRSPAPNPWAPAPTPGAPEGVVLPSVPGAGWRAARPRPPRQPRPPVPDGPLVAVLAMSVIAALCGWFLLDALVLGGTEQARAQRGLYQTFRTQIAAQTAPLGGAIEPGSPVAVLTIPTLGLEQVVVEGTASGDLLAGPGHRRDTVLPGQAGVSLVYGKSRTFGAPFRSIGSLREGDGIRVVTGQGEFVYRVDGVRRAGDPLPAAPASGGSRLTLVTGDGGGALGVLGATSTVFVDATLQGQAAVGEAGRPARVPDAEKALGRDTSVLGELFLVLTGLLLAVVAVSLMAGRVSSRLGWVLGAPILVAFAWAASDAAMELLPNLM